MSRKPSSKKTNELKLKRMRLILEKLKKGAMSLPDVIALCKTRKRTVQYYLEELCALGLVIYDEHQRVYEIAESKKVFQSRHDYDIALKHSKNLVFSTRNEIRLIEINLSKALEIIATKDMRGDIDLTCFSQHLRSGYPEIQVLIEKYRKLTSEGESKDGLTKNDYSVYQEESDFDSEDLKEKRKKRKDKDNLEALLAWKIFLARNQVRNGTPLQGFCDCCPDKKITIKDSQEEPRT